MKVTSGKFKGRNLNENPYEHIRPTADIVKQSIFNKLFEEVVDATVLDLFCGTGALGIEAISRGAKRVVFVDKDKRSVTLTKSNLKKLGINAEVFNADFELALDKLKGTQFDIILLDPPYKEGLYKKALDKIFENDLLANEGLIVCEHLREDIITHSAFEAVSERNYGIKSLTYFKLKKQKNLE